MKINTSVVGLLLTLFCACAEEPAAPAATPLRPVQWVAIQMHDGVRERSFSGSAKASNESTLSFKVAGTIEDIPVQVGERVSAGQLIARLDPRDFELMTEEADAALLDASAQSREAAANYDRYRLLYEADNTSKSQLDASRAATESAAAAVTAARKRLEIAELQLGYTQLVAPVDGAIAAKLVEVNENVGQGTAIVEMTSGSRIEVEVAVPGLLIVQISTGAPCLVTFDAIADRSFPSTVTEVGVSSTGLQTTFPVTVQLRDEVTDVLPGMAAQVQLAIGDATARERALVPAVAVNEDRSGRHVYVVVDDGPDLGRIERREVVVGDLAAGGQLEILEGLLAGDRLITRGISKMSDGMAVRLPESGTSR